MLISVSRSMNSQNLSNINLEHSVRKILEIEQILVNQEKSSVEWVEILQLKR